MEQGNKFEKSLYDLLSARFNNKMINLQKYTHQWHQHTVKTLEAMKKGIPIIYSGALVDPVNQIYGIPDLLVRSDWICKLVSSADVDDDMDCGSPHLGHKKYHYRAVDIKFTTLPLRADGSHILNSGYMPAYKGQLYIYNKILGEVQGYTPVYAYLLGRKWKYASLGIEYKGNSCLDRLGLVAFCDVDKDIAEMVYQAISWVRDMRKNGHLWNINKTPLPRPELYPNMSNRNDQPWHDIKSQIASDIKEITSLWMCGPKQRIYAHKQKIYQWTSKKCNVDTLNLKGDRKRKILSHILEINQEPSKKAKKAKNAPLISPQVLNNNNRNWQKKQALEFFIDFETINDIYPDFTQLPIAESLTMIFMIGVGYISPQTGEWIYRHFTVNDLTLQEERRICHTFTLFITEAKKTYQQDRCLLFHWSNAEKVAWDRAFERHGYEKMKLDNKKDKYCTNKMVDVDRDLFDLLAVFHQAPIAIKGCLSYGLKEVAAAMYKHKLISTIWSDDNPCYNGPAAMVMAYRAAQDSQNKNLSFQAHPTTEHIRQYNEIDCKVLWDIVTYLRNNHCSS
jgi:hypothetical protein